MTTPVPTPGEPDIYEVLLDALIAASTAFLDAESHFQASYPYMTQSIALHGQADLVSEQARRASHDASGLMAEYLALMQDNPQENLARARDLMAEVRDAHDRAQALYAGSLALSRQALVETEQGMAIWNDGAQALRTGLERATTLLQQARRHHTNGGTPDAQAA